MNRVFCENCNDYMTVNRLSFIYRGCRRIPKELMRICALISSSFYFLALILVDQIARGHDGLISFIIFMQ